ncbi:transporter substrate-binding domain-containing protein [Sodalis sp. dw_96]|uniref:substrate-binding periplasmic protein n=1 Tax=Sodalis sp. dw_96 TaxID=2719794 RepID=UPI001BD28180|nr:transporter substrate-binding domain-containing protein [Sodalis sp. dw_96]
MQQISVVAGKKKSFRMIFWGLISSAIIFAQPAISADGDTLANIKKTGVLKVATVAANAPWESINPDGSFTGYDIDIAELLGKQLGVKVQYIRTDIAGRVASLQTHKADITIAVFTPTPERQAVVSFSTPYMMDGVQLLTRADSPYKDVKSFDNDGLTIGVTRGSTTAAKIGTQLPKAKVSEFAGQADLISALDSKQVSAVASNNGLIALVAKNSGNKFLALSPLLLTEEDAIGAAKGDDAWVKLLNDFINKINSDGTNYRLAKKWFGIEPPDFIKAPAQ